VPVVPESPPTAPRRAPPARRPRAPSAPSPATLKLSQRIVLHIYAQGRATSEYVAPAALSQAGMGAALGEPQNHLAKALARLVAGGVLAVHRRHVSGNPRRLLVYTLTPLGEALARDLRRTVDPGPVVAPPAWMGRP
jgi:DNA-binding PadR family transcriptional regulator